MAKEIIQDYDTQIRSITVNDLSDLDMDMFTASFLQKISYFLQKYAEMITGYGVSQKQRAEFRVTLSDNSILDYKDYLSFYSAKVISEYQNHTSTALRKENVSDAQLMAMYDRATEIFETAAVSSGNAIRQLFHCDQLQFDCEAFNCTDVNNRLDHAWEFSMRVIVNEFMAEIFIAQEAVSNYRKLMQQHEFERAHRSEFYAAFRQTLEALLNRVPMPSRNLLTEMKNALGPYNLTEATRLLMMTDVVNGFIYKDHMIRHVKSRFSRSFEYRSDDELRVFRLPSEVVFAKGEAHQNATSLLDILLEARTILPSYSKEKEEALRKEILVSLDKHELAITTLETGAISYSGYLDYIDFGFFMALIYTGINAWHGKWVKACGFGMLAILAFLKMVYFTFRETIWTFIDKAVCIWTTLSTWTHISSFSRLWGTSAVEDKANSNSNSNPNPSSSPSASPLSPPSN